MTTSVINKNKGLIPLLFILMVTSCITTSSDNLHFTKNELAVINSGSDSTLMYIYNIDNPEDTTVLRSKSSDLNNEEILSDDFKRLKSRMLATVMHPDIDGVGLAAPQIGINRRVVAVQRFDKPGHPFEVYANINILEFCGEIKNGPEGCLSVPGKSGNVPRYETVIISYFNDKTQKEEQDTVSGYTSVIFQHEVDHLEGIIYTDKIVE